MSVGMGMTETETETEVVISGAGPTGLALACELALAGVDTLVLEKLPHRIDQVKGGSLQPRTAELLEMRGLLEPMLRRSLPREAVGGHFAMLPVPLDCSPWHTRHPYPITIPQGDIEEILEERAVSLGARVLREHAVAAVTAVIAEDSADGPDGGVSVTTDAGLSVRARYLVACDGGHSPVRKLLGLPFPGRPGTYQAVLADIRLSATSPQVPTRIAHISEMTRRAHGYWAMLVPIGGDRYRLTFGRMGDAADHPSDAAGEPDDAAGHTSATTGHTDDARDTPVTDREIAEALHAVYGPATELGGVENSSRFTDATRQLEHYRAGERILFAGDAAHIHPPFGGQGLNTGVQDAFNLGWKLAAAVQGRAPEGLLDTYHAERHPVGAQVLQVTSAQRVLATTEPGSDEAALAAIFTDLMRLPDTNRYLAGLMSGLSLAYDLPGAHPLTGHRLPDADIVIPDGARTADSVRTADSEATANGWFTADGQATADGERTRLSALFATGHAVLLDLAGVVPPGTRLPTHLDHVRATCAEGLPAAAILVRPDGYACWATDDPATALADVRPAIATLTSSDSDIYALSVFTWPITLA
jgi:2-polyprenyl-6-methoxyphenol hydroxylase-like FAD-dependent oxidoreductase